MSQEKQNQQPPKTSDSREVNHDGEFWLDADTQGEYLVACMTHIEWMNKKIKAAKHMLDRAEIGIDLATTIMLRMNTKGRLPEVLVQVVESWQREEK